MPPHTSNRNLASLADHLPAVAGGTMVLWLAVEFAFRRGLGPLLAAPLGTGLGAAAISMALGGTVAAAGIAWVGRRAGVARADWEYDVSVRAVAAGLAGLVGIYLLRGLGVAVLVFGLGFELPTGTGGVDFGLAAAPTWAVVAFFLANGVVVPVVEELAWRGVIQTALTESYGTGVAVAVTAAAFVVKHLVVDMAVMPFRTTALVVLAVGLCVLRARYGTASSTVAHLLMNSAETGMLVAAVLT